VPWSDRPRCRQKWILRPTRYLIGKNLGPEGCWREVTTGGPAIPVRRSTETVTLQNGQSFLDKPMTTAEAHRTWGTHRPMHLIDARLAKVLPRRREDRAYEGFPIAIISFLFIFPFRPLELVLIISSRHWFGLTLWLHSADWSYYCQELSAFRHALAPCCAGSSDHMQNCSLPFV